MVKRTIKLGGYDTAANGWTLTAWKLSAAEPKTNYVSRTGGDGSFDFSTVLTEGVMRYEDRNLAVSLECSDGDRLFRERKIRQMINLLDGMRMDVELPDDADHYVTGRLHVTREYNDMAHASVAVSAVCEPWKYDKLETVVTLSATAEKQAAVIANNGRRLVVPTLSVSAGGEIHLETAAASTTLAGGTCQWPDFLLAPGKHELLYSGQGTVTITYREAVLE